MKKQDVMKPKVLKRFWSKVAIRDLFDCWLWTSCIRSRKDGTDPRALFHIAGKTEYAPRVMWTILHEEISKGMCVLHHCDNPTCINPSHLFLGTQNENIQDMVQKGRQRGARGSRNFMTKLTAEKVLRIKQLLKQAVPRDDIAKQFEVSTATIQDIRKGKSWTYLDA